MKAKSIVSVLCAIALLLAFAPAKVLSVPIQGGGIQGGGDSEPIGPGPHGIMHAPASIARTTQDVTVWGHLHNSPDFEDTFIPMYRGSTLLPHSVNRTVYAMGGTSWDIRYDVTILSSAGLVNGDVITWYVDFYDLATWEAFGASASTNVTN